MSQYKYAEIADTVYFWFAANTTAGTAGDGATPLYDVRLAGAEANAAPTASGTPTLLTHANYSDGLHEIAIDTTGYAEGEYAVFCTLTISSVNPAGFVGSFKLRTAGTSALDVNMVSQANIDFGATQKASINTEVDTAITDARLDELLAADSDIDGATPPTIGSVFHELMGKAAGSFTFDQTTDSLQAIRDNEGTLGAALSAIPWNADWDAEVQSECADAITADAEIDAIKGVTDKIDGMLAFDDPVYKYTANALEDSPTGTGGFTSDDRTTLEAIPTKGEIVGIVEGSK